MNTKNDQFQNGSAVYCRVKSWRFGNSLGIDPLFQTSICSFNCVYCQLGSTQKHTNRRGTFVSTSTILANLEKFSETNFDVLTFSENGEPTLAANLGEISSEIKKKLPLKPQIILTNGTQLDDINVQNDLANMDRVIIKLDASSEEELEKYNRPCSKISLESILSGILEFKKNYAGVIDIQCMFFEYDQARISRLAQIIKKINPASVQLNTPTRPYPLSWHLENRGNHSQIFDYEVRNLQNISREDANRTEQELSLLTGIKILSVYRDR